MIAVIIDHHIIYIYILLLLAKTVLAIIIAIK